MPIPIVAMLGLLFALLLNLPVRAAEPTIVIAGESYTATALLARPDVRTLSIADDISYGRSMTYRAIPLRALLAPLARGGADTVEVRATDGFVAQLPLALLARSDAVPWLAIENPALPWPKLPKGKTSAGPFYIVWQNAAKAGVSPEQWPYAIASLAAVASPAQRWPSLAVSPALATAAPARRGQAVFASNCFACHRLGGAGEASVGPDLLLPMPATTYFTDAGLRALIRNPASVRHWPEQRMPGFGADVVSDDDVEAVVAYLRHLGDRK